MSTACPVSPPQVVGYFNTPTIIVGTTTLTREGEFDSLVIRYNSANGDVVWYVQGPTPIPGSTSLGRTGYTADAYTTTERTSAPAPNYSKG